MLQLRRQRTYETRLLVQSGKRKRRLLEANSSPQKYQTLSPKKTETHNTPDETRMHIIIKWENTKYKVLVDTGATHSYISKEFFKQIEKLDYEIKKPSNNKLIVANGQKLEITGQVLIPIEVGHTKKYLLSRLVPELRSTGILGTDMIERLGLKLDFEKEIEKNRKKQATYNGEKYPLVPQPTIPDLKSSRQGTQNGPKYQ